MTARLTTSITGPRIRVARLPRHGWSTRYDRRAVRRTGIIVLAVVLTGAFALTRGAAEIGVGDLARVLTGGGNDISRLVVLEWRMPRIMMAITAGAALATAGAFVQTITRNPLGSPDVIGFSAGSYFGVLVVVVVLHAPREARGPGAIAGGLLAAAAVWLLANRGGITGFRLIIVGIGISSLLTGLSTWLVLTSTDEQFKTVTFWGAGSLDALTWSSITPAVILVGLLLLAATPLSGPLRQLELGDRAARASGARVELSRALALALSILLVATITATCGPIEFVALAAPQIARRITGTSSIGIVSAAATGALLVLIADLIGDELSPVGLPAGVVTLIFGGAYLTALLINEARRP